MKHPNTGIYEYCAQLLHAMASKLHTEESLTSYAPTQVDIEWPSGIRRLKQRSWHTFWMPRWRDAAVWHGTYQQTRYMPSWKLPKILTVHDLNFLYERRSEKSRQRNWRRLLKNVRRTDHIVAISRFVARDIETNVPIDGKPVHVIYNGCDVRYDSAFDAPRYRPSRPFCFTIGPTIPKKNFHVLPCLLRKNDFELVIAGANRHHYAHRIVEEAERHNVADRVVLVGNVSHEEKFWYYRHCSAFVFPSIAEGFGLPVIEAMHFGKKVLLSNRTSLPEIGGRFATYFDSFDPDAMSAVFDRAMSASLDPEEAAAAIRHAASFSWENSATEYLNVYRLAANEPAAG